jgi:hypothetical protein
VVDYGEHYRRGELYRRRREHLNGSAPKSSDQGGGLAGLSDAIRQADEQTAGIWNAFLDAREHLPLTGEDVAAMLSVSAYLRSFADRLALEE